MKIDATASGKNNIKPMMKNDLDGTVDVLDSATCTYDVDSDGPDEP
jgi:hypothetical protein